MTNSTDTEAAREAFERHVREEWGEGMLERDGDGYEASPIVEAWVWFNRGRASHEAARPQPSIDVLREARDALKFYDCNPFEPDLDKLQDELKKPIMTVPIAEQHKVARKTLAALTAEIEKREGVCR